MSRNELHGPLAHPEPKRSGNEALGIHRGLDAIANLQLSEHLVDVLVDGVRGNVEVVRNLAVGQSTQDVAEYLQLALRASLPPAARRGRVAGNPFRRTSTWTGRIR